MNRLVLLVLIGSTFTGCVQAQKPYRFTAQDKDQSVGAIARAMSSAGMAPKLVDPAVGIVQTEWTTTQSYCTRSQGTGKIVQRYVATVAPGSGAAEVVLRLESKCCDESNLDFGDVQLRSGCVQMSEIFEFQQKELDSLGAQLRAEVAGPTAG